MSASHTHSHITHMCTVNLAKNGMEWNLILISSHFIIIFGSLTRSNDEIK